ncbi:MAG: enamine deaminase RidA (YjgF/YER057c/UK114 family) [Flavobacteriales bacterium]|jgi:enamine deaminase RidA (YjgF/YER057c/UK114 family)
MNTYIVNFTPETDLPIFRKIRNKFKGSENHLAITVVGVAMIENKNWLIEIEAIAIIK